MTVLQAHGEVEGDSGIPAITRGIACLEKTSSAPTGPLLAGDGSGWSRWNVFCDHFFGFRDRDYTNILLIYVIKGSSRVSRREEVLQPVRAILIFPKPFISV